MLAKDRHVDPGGVHSKQTSQHASRPKHEMPVVLLLETGQRPARVLGTNGRRLYRNEERRTKQMANLLGLQEKARGPTSK